METKITSTVRITLMEPSHQIYWRVHSSPHCQVVRRLNMKWVAATYSTAYEIAELNLIANLASCHKDNCHTTILSDITTEF